MHGTYVASAMDFGGVSAFFNVCGWLSSTLVVCTAIDRRLGLLLVQVAVSEVLAVVWVLDLAQIVVSAVVAMEVVTVVDGDVVVGARSTGCKTEG